jgi:mannose-6-phosphate isomerase-like protein (cupin superfamily)
MNRLIEAFEGLFTAATASGGELAKTANFLLENVNWAGALEKHEPTSQAVVDTYLETACANSGAAGSSTQKLAEALLAVTDQLNWRAYTTGHEHEPDIAVFSRNYSPTTVIGNGGLLPSDKVTAGFSLQGRDIYYPPHAHHAEESYWIIGGDGDWRVGTKPWFAVAAGDSIYHEPWARHAMQTNEQPLLSVWLWTSYLDSEVLIVRD